MKIKVEDLLIEVDGEEISLKQFLGRLNARVGDLERTTSMLKTDMDRDLRHTVQHIKEQISRLSKS